ncbi:hypothetical protein Ahy_A05g023515 isoform B [Arachis hypogaea]|uniref:RRM domain-containing protein n=1 Tax=Arachis hypogaea TaxID=3818 RepID=A0A445D472_ARAHY|nr:hypothetical protein Ahy_A05g023515 isoform B [Arachis hypogaea]
MKNKKTMEVAVKEENAENEPNGSESKLKDKKKRLLKEAEKADKRGVCYLSRIPPHMDHVKLRHILSQFGDIQRIFLAPEDSSAPVSTKRSRGARDQAYSEGWVEFKNKRLAKRVANMLNGEQIGGKKRSSFYYDLWNIKYLSKFKWDDLTEELALKKAIREQKIALELSAAKRERDLYLSKVDKSRALNAIEERLKKKQKIQQDSGQVAKVIRHFPQTKPITATAKESKPGLSDDILDAPRLCLTQCSRLLPHVVSSIPKTSAADPAANHHHVHVAPSLRERNATDHCRVAPPQDPLANTSHPPSRRPPHFASQMVSRDRHQVSGGATKGVAWSAMRVTMGEVALQIGHSNS